MRSSRPWCKGYPPSTRWNRVVQLPAFVNPSAFQMEFFSPSPCTSWCSWISKIFKLPPNDWLVFNDTTQCSPAVLVRQTAHHERWRHFSASQTNELLPEMSHVCALAAGVHLQTRRSTSFLVASVLRKRRYAPKCFVLSRASRSMCRYFLYL